MRTPSVPTLFRYTTENGRLIFENPEKRTGRYVLSASVPYSEQYSVPSSVPAASSSIPAPASAFSIPVAVSDEDGNVSVTEITDVCDGYVSFCFAATLRGTSVEVFTPLDELPETPPNEVSYASETPKTVEGDFLHLTENDNGTLVVAAKESGAVYFEMPTLLRCVSIAPQNGKTPSPKVYTGRAERFCRVASPVHGEFHTVLTVPDFRENVRAGFDPEAAVTPVFLRVFLGRCEPFLRLSVTFIAPQNEDTLVLRLPTGTFFTSRTDLSGTRSLEDGAFFTPSGKVAFDDGCGTVFSVLAQCVGAFGGASNADPGNTSVGTTDGVSDLASDDVSDFASGNTSHDASDRASFAFFVSDCAASISCDAEGNIDLVLYAPGFPEAPGTECERWFIIKP